MTAKAKRYWGAVLKSTYEANLTSERGKVYYHFDGSELMVGDTVADVVRAIAETGMDQEWMVFKYVPSSTSMHAACWAALKGELEDVTFKVRVHEKFAFPRIDRGGNMVLVEERPSAGLLSVDNLQGLGD
jgi:hypothetical protein